jgi:hypothetical protein
MLNVNFEAMNIEQKIDRVLTEYNFDRMSFDEAKKELYENSFNNKADMIQFANDYIKHINQVKKSDSLLPCPFCKSIDVEYEFSCSQGRVKCNSCGVEGPEVSEAADPICSISAAKEAWNNR